MINLEEIENTIEELENREVTFANCQKLATLYTIRDHNIKGMPAIGESEFLETIAGADTEAALLIINEQIEVTRILHPREYAAFITKLKSIK